MSLQRKTAKKGPKPVLVALFGAAIIAAAAALVLPKAFAAKPSTLKDPVYKLIYRGEQGTPSVLYVSLARDVWRDEMKGVTYISTPRTYTVVRPGVVYHRTGTPQFIGLLHESPAVVALRAYLSGKSSISGRSLTLSGAGRAGENVRLQVAGRGKVELRALRNGRRLFTVTIERRLTAGRAAELRLFDAPGANVSDQQLAVGQAPTVPVSAYWFGPAINGKRAAAAAQHERHRSAEEIAGGMNARGESEVQVTFYENPGVPQNGSQPGVLRPAGELQVTNEPLASAHAQ